MFIDLSIGEKRSENRLLNKNFKNSYFYKYPKIRKKTVLIITKWIKKRYNLKVKKKNIIPTLGNRESLFTTFIALINKKKNVLIPKPFYHIYKKIDFFKKKKIYTYNYKKILKFFKKKKIIKNTNFVIVNSPNNFNGFFYKKKTIKKINKFSKKYGFYIISDECYSEIYYKKKPTSFLETKKNNNIIVLNSLSKRSFSPGLRSGFLYSNNKKVIKKILKIKNISGTIPSIFVQKKSEILWNNEIHVKNVRRFYNKNINDFILFLKKNKIKYKKPKSGFYIWLRKPKKISLEKIIKYFAKEKIKVSNGKIFGSKKHIRLALVEKFSLFKKKIKKVFKKIYDRKRNK